MQNFDEKNFHKAAVWKIRRRWKIFLRKRDVRM
jgi:hypothetical protein